jgi:DNA-binding NarL/FixJ family response regulator
LGPPLAEAEVSPVREFTVTGEGEDRGSGIEPLAAEGTDRSATYLVLAGETDDRLEWLRAGEALSAVWLTAVLDARLPDGSGIDVCRQIRSVDPTIQALILTSYEDDEALFAAIMAGAAGYVLKQIKGTDLVDAVRRVAAGQSLLDPAVTTRVLDRIRRGPDQPDELKTSPTRNAASSP